MKRAILSLLVIVFALCSTSINAGEKKHVNDPHYLSIGFFDLHVCNWSDRKPFFLAVFSSYQYDMVKIVKVFAPDGKPVGNFDLGKFRIIDKKGKPRKKVFLTQMPLIKPHQDGWYRAEIEMNDGTRYQAKDFVKISIMPRVRNPVPSAGATDIPAPREFSWDPVPGAKYYRVYIKDIWGEERVIHSSKWLTEPRFIVPSGLLQTGGYYSWRVHARDVNEDPMLGDFNHGSLTGDIEFTVKP